MSTKSSLAYGDKFHLYAECFDDNNIHLELEGEFEAVSGRVIVSIPLEIWEVIRHHTNVDLSLVDKSDGDIGYEVVKFVKDRMVKVEAAKAEGREPGLIAVSGCMVYGSTEDPIETQIQSGFDHMIERRTQQRALRDKIRTLKQSRGAAIQR